MHTRTTRDIIMPDHIITFKPSGRSVEVSAGTTILDAARLASEPIVAECGGRGACGKCLVEIVEGDISRSSALPIGCEGRRVLACLTQVSGPLTVRVLAETELPQLISETTALRSAPLDSWAPWELSLDPLTTPESDDDLGVAVDIGTTTLRLLVIRLSDGTIVGEADAYNPQISWGADVISRIVSAEKGHLEEMAGLVRSAVVRMLGDAAQESDLALDRIRVYVVSGNLTMIHLLLGVNPSGIRRVPSEPVALEFPPKDAESLGWPGKGNVLVHTLPAAGGWVGGDIISGIVRSGFSRREDRLTLYVDLGTNGEIALGGSDFTMTCACSAGPAFEGSGIRCGMRADRGAIDGARVDLSRQALDLSVIGGDDVRGVCGSGLISLADVLFASGWIDRGAKFTETLPERYAVHGKYGKAVALSPDGRIALYERDLTSLIRAKAAVFSGIRSLIGELGIGISDIDEIIVSGNFGRYLNLPAAVGIGLLPNLPPGRYVYVNNGSLEGAALALLSRQFLNEMYTYIKKVTYVDLSDVPGYMDEFVAASFLPHTDVEALRA